MSHNKDDEAKVARLMNALRAAHGESQVPIAQPYGFEKLVMSGQASELPPPLLVNNGMEAVNTMVKIEDQWANVTTDDTVAALAELCIVVGECIAYAINNMKAGSRVPVPPGLAGFIAQSVKVSAEHAGVRLDMPGVPGIDPRFPGPDEPGKPPNILH